MTRCLPPGPGTLDDRIRDGLETGRLQPGDADEVLRYRDFLADAAAHPDEPRAAVYARHYPEAERA